MRKVLLLLLLGAVVFAQDFTLEWNTTFDTGQQDIVYDTSFMNSGEVIMVGYTNYSGTYDWVIVKFNESSGVQTFNMTYDNGSSEYAYGVDVDSEGNVIITGETNHGTSSVSADYLTIKCYPNMTQQWNVTYDGGDLDVPTMGVAVDSNDSAIVAGVTRLATDDFFIIKYNKDGVQEWNDTYDSGGEERGCIGCVAVDPSDDSVVVTGYSSTGSDISIVLLKYYSNGTRKFAKIIDFSNLDRSVGVAAWYSNIYLTARSNATGSSEYYLFKFNDSGLQEWNISLGSYYEPVDLVVDSQGNVLVAGRYTSNLTLWKILSNKTIVWNKTYSGIGSVYAIDLKNDNTLISGLVKYTPSTYENIVAAKFVNETTQPLRQSIVVSSPELSPVIIVILFSLILTVFLLIVIKAGSS